MHLPRANLHTFQSESDARAAGGGVVWDEAKLVLSVARGRCRRAR
jgi:hypothetical protein